jgi:hypothetical protein
MKFKILSEMKPDEDSLYYFLFIFKGWAVGQKGPSFPDLRMIVNKDLGTASWIFTITAIGYMLGSLVGGKQFVTDRISTLLISMNII